MLRTSIPALLLPLFLIAHPLESAASKKKPTHEFDWGDCTCESSVSRADTFVPQTYYRRGPNRGKRVDTCFKRSVVLLDRKNEAEFPIANIQHRVRGESHWYRAELDPEQIDYLAAQVSWGAPVARAGHAMLRIHFKTPVRLWAQNSEDQDAPSEIFTRVLVYSVEAVEAQGKPTGTISFGTAGKSLNGSWKIAHRLLTLDAIIQEKMTDRRTRISQRKLDLDRAQIRAFLEGALDRATEKPMRRNYNLLGRNCTTELLRIFDKWVTRKSDRHGDGHTTAEFLPSHLEEALRVRGILAPRSERHLPDLKPEDGEDSVSIKVPGN